VRQVSIICRKCGVLVSVVDKIIAERNGCETGGMRYVPSPRVFKAGHGAPAVEVIATDTLDVPCQSCGETHVAALALLKVSQPDPSVN